MSKTIITIEALQVFKLTDYEYSLILYDLHGRISGLGLESAAEQFNQAVADVTTGPLSIRKKKDKPA